MYVKYNNTVSKVLSVTVQFLNFNLKSIIEQSAVNYTHRVLTHQDINKSINRINQCFTELFVCIARLSFGTRLSY